VKNGLKYLLILALIFAVVSVGHSEKAEAATQTQPITVFIQGEELSFDQPPIIKGGRTLVPVRAIFENLGATVSYDSKTKVVKAIRNDKTIIIKLGSTAPTVNGKTVTIDVPAQAINGRTLVPLRFVSESFGAEVEWDGPNKVIDIYVWKLESDLFFSTDTVGNVKSELTEDQFLAYMDTMNDNEELINVTTWVHLLDKNKDLSTYHVALHSLNGVPYVMVMTTEGSIRNGTVSGYYDIEVFDIETGDTVDQFDGDFVDKPFVNKSLSFTISQALQELNK
jgi:hypothetical protein